MFTSYPTPFRHIPVKGNIMSESIVKYIVRIPGSSPLGEYATEGDARKECSKINRICCPGHKIYAEYADGTVTELS